VFLSWAGGSCGCCSCRRVWWLRLRLGSYCCWRSLRPTAGTEDVHCSGWYSCGYVYGCFYVLPLRLLAADVVAASGGHDCGSCCGWRLRLPAQWSPWMRMRAAVADGEGRQRARRGIHRVVILSNKNLRYS
jgi:hypothetical protein